MKDWDEWVLNHDHPLLAAIVLQWLNKHDFDEAVWQAADAIVELLDDQETNKKLEYPSTNH